MKVYIFDMDGTFIDSMDFWNNLMTEFLKTKNIEAEGNLQLELLNLTFHDGVKYVKEMYDIEESEEELFINVTNLIGHQYKNVFNIDKDAINIFEKIRSNGDKVVLATATQRNLVDIVLDRFSLRDHFDLQIVSDESKYHKDNPEYFMEIANHFNVPCSDCVVVEDALYSISSARKAGMKVFGVLFQSPKEHLEKIISLCEKTGQRLEDLYEYF